MTDMNERVARLEGRMDSTERRVDGHSSRLARVEVDVDKMREDNKELMKFLHQATGAFNGARIVGWVISFLFGIGIISITFGG